MFNKQKEKYYDNQNQKLNEELLEIKFQYEAMLETLKAKNRQADDLIKQLTLVMAHVKKKYKKELEDYNNGK